jgi:hypothetical protein
MSARQTLVCPLCNIPIATHTNIGPLIILNLRCINCEADQTGGEEEEAAGVETFYYFNDNWFVKPSSIYTRRSHVQVLVEQPPSHYTQLMKASGVSGTTHYVRLGSKRVIIDLNDIDDPTSVFVKIK